MHQTTARADDDVPSFHFRYPELAHAPLRCLGMFIDTPLEGPVRVGPRIFSHRIAVRLADRVSSQKGRSSGLSTA